MGPNEIGGVGLHIILGYGGRKRPSSPRKGRFLEDVAFELGLGESPPGEKQHE